MSFSIGNYLASRINLKSAGNLLHNPEKSLLSKNLRESKGWKQYGRPAVKIASDIGIAYLTGGVSGAIAGGLYGATSDTNSHSYQPVNNIIAPAAIGYMSGHSTSGKAFNNGLKAGLTPTESAQLAYSAGGGASGIASSIGSTMGQVGTGMSLLGRGQGLGQQQSYWQQPQRVASTAGLAQAFPAGGAQNQTQDRQLYAGQGLMQGGLNNQINGVAPTGG